VLTSSHALVLRAVALGQAPEDSPALRNLAIAGLIAPVDGVWALTQTGHAVLEIEGGTQTAGGETGDLMAKVRAWFMT
jgi:3-deoxy-D-manno-octulosonate 8-phosphate phosphatase KdsC-like HAD superfamily phosphatase